MRTDGRGTAARLRSTSPSARRPTVEPCPPSRRIAYEAGRSALADQDAGVPDPAAHRHAPDGQPIVASFIGATTIKDQGLQLLGWIAVASLVLAVVVAAILLAP
jgi:hypothetical protein